jgi:hypothetical protein
LGAGKIIRRRVGGDHLDAVRRKKQQKKVAEVTDQVIDKVDGLQQTIKKFANA